MNRDQFKTVARDISNPVIMVNTGAGSFSEDDFATGLRVYDAALSDLAQQWVDARRKMAEHIRSKG